MGPGISKEAADQCKAEKGINPAKPVGKRRVFLLHLGCQRAEEYKYCYQ